MGGGISIGPGSPLRSIGQEWPQINQLFNSDFSGPNSALSRYDRRSPLLNQANNQALSFSGGVNGLIGQLGRDQSALGGLFGDLGSISSSLGGLLPELGRGLNTVNQTVNSGGALTSDQTRQVNQDTAAQFASRGNIAGNQAIVTDVMNLQNARDTRFQNALQEQGQLTSEISGIRGQQAGIRGAQAGIIGARAGLTGETQNLQTGALNQLEQTQGADVGTFATLSDPLLNFANSIFSGNQFAALSTQIANQNKGAGVAGGGISGAGNILQSILPLLGLSDRRLKEKIKSTGEKTPGGTPIKTFQFKGDPHQRRHIGVIAQDVAKHEPHAVYRGPGGLLGVHHRMIGAPRGMIGRGSGGAGRPRAGRGREGEGGRGGRFQGGGLDPSQFPPWLTSMFGDQPRTPEQMADIYQNLQNINEGNRAATMNEPNTNPSGYQYLDQNDPIGGDPNFEPTPIPDRSGDPGDPSTVATGGDPWGGGQPGNPWGATLDPTTYDPWGYPNALPVWPSEGGNDQYGGDLWHMLING